MLASLMDRLVMAQEKSNERRQTLSQKDVASILAAVPSVAPNGDVLSGSKLLAWFKELDTTYLGPDFFGSQFSYNAMQTLFTAAPALLATFKQVTQSNEKVIALRRAAQWREAWAIVAQIIIATHTGDRHQAQRKWLKPAGYLLQHGDKTVLDASTAQLEHVQSRNVLGL
jgi:hypothetical protein